MVRPPFLIREGRPGDMPALRQMIEALARYEKAEHEATLSESTLLKDWAEHRAFDFLIAEQKGTAVGMALYYPRYSTWKGRCFYLEDIYVMEHFRGNGLGKALLQAVADKAREAGALRLDWQVLDWNQPAVDFYESIGAHIEKDWWNGKWWL